MTNKPMTEELIRESVSKLDTRTAYSQHAKWLLHALDAERKAHEKTSGRLDITEFANKAIMKRAEKAEDALERKGYRKSCDIPACNCGDRWTHGGNASTRLEEISNELSELTQGVTILDAIRQLKERVQELEEKERDTQLENLEEYDT